MEKKKEDLITLSSLYLLINRGKYVFVTLIFIACSSNKKVSSFKPSSPVIVMMSKPHKKVYRIDIPFGIKIKNSSPSKLSFVTINYNYFLNKKGIGEDLFIYNDAEELVEIENNQIMSISPFLTNKYIIYSRYQIDSSEVTQKELKPYILKMLKNNLDTFRIKSVLEFKKKHAALFEKLTKGDSISIQFLDNGKLGEYVTVPAKW
ncbi:hypothetical protein [Tenacibaculum larymnensis]|uniref:Lipoprotein n=1 Tax=Tenacibaculum larymnensis TaxID=2878201 RepID=A0A9X4IRS5_9FLAO|nr:hypothetical protein [Tenacibaculum larymnensis]MDE1208242.1 hypothetical protein [Tenacibaculum larymnensis]